MKINILLFATLREKLNQSELQLEFDGHTVADALEALANQYPQLQPIIANGRVQTAVNEEYATPATEIKENDTLALIPPVSGGDFKQ